MSLRGVVVNYKTPEDLEGFLASWEAHAPEWAELVVVNVDPGPADREIGRALDQPYSIKVGDIHHLPSIGNYPVKLLKSATVRHPLYTEYTNNVGYSRACNEAVATSDADVYAFFNADTRLLPGVIEPLYLNLMTHEDWGVIGPRQVDDHGKITHAGILGTGDKPQLRGWLQPDNPAFCDIRDDAVSVMGSAYFVRSDCWQQLWDCPTYRELHPEAAGAFLPTQHYYEETWCSYHARAHGWKVVYYGLAKMIHRWHKASPVGGFADRHFSASQQTFREACDAHGILRD